MDPVVNIFAAPADVSNGRKLRLPGFSINSLMAAVSSGIGILPRFIIKQKPKPDDLLLGFDNSESYYVTVMGKKNFKLWTKMKRDNFCYEKTEKKYKLTIDRFPEKEKNLIHAVRTTVEFPYKAYTPPNVDAAKGFAQRMQLIHTAKSKGIIRMKGAWTYSGMGSERIFSSALVGSYAPVFDYIWPGSVKNYSSRGQKDRNFKLFKWVKNFGNVPGIYFKSGTADPFLKYPKDIFKDPVLKMAMDKVDTKPPKKRVNFLKNACCKHACMCAQSSRETQLSHIKKKTNAEGNPEKKGLPAGAGHDKKWRKKSAHGTHEQWPKTATSGRKLRRNRGGMGEHSKQRDADRWGNDKRRVRNAKRRHDTVSMKSFRGHDMLKIHMIEMHDEKKNEINDNKKKRMSEIWVVMHSHGPKMKFDSTLGYPGEGPKSYGIMSWNATGMTVKKAEWLATQTDNMLDAIMIQESGQTLNTLRTTKKEIKFRMTHQNTSHPTKKTHDLRTKSAKIDGRKRLTGPGNGLITCMTKKKGNKKLPENVREWLKNYSSPKTNLLITKTEIHAQQFLLLNCYQPPRTRKNELFDTLIELDYVLSDLIQFGFTNIIIGSDFNAKHKMWCPNSDSDCKINQKKLLQKREKID